MEDLSATAMKLSLLYLVAGPGLDPKIAKEMDAEVLSTLEGVCTPKLIEELSVNRKALTGFLTGLKPDVSMEREASAGKAWLYPIPDKPGLFLRIVVFENSLRADGVIRREETG